MAKRVRVTSCKKDWKKLSYYRKEFQEFLDHTQGMDISNEYKIKLAGQIKRETSK